MQNNIDAKFTRDVAQNLFDLLTPNTTPGRSTKADVSILKRLKKDSNSEKTEMVDFLSGTTPRSSVDIIDSYNRIPCDRAQDAIIYFVEEILGLGEIDLSKAEKKKKTVWKDPSKQIDEETYAKHYLLYSDSDGIKYRLSISHTFLKIEVRTKRPNLTKTDKTGKASFQMHWQPLRVKKQADGSLGLVQYPIKQIVINNASKKSIAKIDENMEKEWESAYPIGKRNLVDLAIDLRTECALALFDNKPLHESLKDAHITKYFFMLNELIKQDARMDVFDVVKPKKQDKQSSGLDLEVSVAQPIADLGNSEFTDKFELVSSSLNIGLKQSPAFRIDVYDENFMLELLMNYYYGLEPQISAIAKTRDMLEHALEMNFPSSNTVFHKAYRSVFMFPKTSIYIKANALNRTNSSNKSAKKVQVAFGSQDSTSYIPAERNTTSVEREEFTFKIENFERNSAAFMFSTSVLDEKISSLEPKLTNKLFDLDGVNKLHIVGGMYFDLKIQDKTSFYIHLYITHLLHTFDIDNLEHDDIATELAKQAKIFIDFMSCWAKLYVNKNIQGIDFFGGIVILEDKVLHTNFDETFMNFVLEDIMGFQAHSTGSKILLLNID